MAKEVGWLVVSCAAVRTFFHQTMPQNPQKWEEIPPAGCNDVNDVVVYFGTVQSSLFDGEKLCNVRLCQM